MTISPLLPKLKCPQCGYGLDKKGRSNQQNRSYWLLIVQPLAEYLSLTTEECHELLKYKFNKEIKFIENRNKIMEEIVKIKSTTVLTTVQFEEMCSQIRIWASQLGCYLKEPNEQS